MTPCAPARFAVRMIAPRLCGSSMPSNRKINGGSPASSAFARISSTAGRRVLRLWWDICIWQTGLTGFWNLRFWDWTVWRKKKSYISIIRKMTGMERNQEKFPTLLEKWVNGDGDLFDKVPVKIVNEQEIINLYEIRRINHRGQKCGSGSISFRQDHW